ncbi:unnamed protein product [Caenorhabditis brenneri]
MSLLSLFLFSLQFSQIATSSPSLFPCPTRCQCYSDNEQNQQVHLICKWEQLNATTLQLARPDLVRTLTIKCPYHSPKVSTPPHSLFQGFRNLDRLELDRCLIDTVPEGLFAGLGQLYSLIVKNAKIADFPREIFAHTPNLMTLDLSGNRLRIEPYSLRSLHNLIHLDLSDNDIGFLTNTMISLTKLKVITMNNNKITNIDFRRFPENLTDLSIRHNLVSTIHYVPASARNLKRLDLSGNRLEFVAGLSTGAVNVLPAELKHVDLSNNKLNYLHEFAFEHLQNLILLDLKNNSLKEVKASSFRGSKYQIKLFLSENTLLCHCNHKWLMDAESKNISIGDLQAIECSNLLKPEKKMLLTLAHSRNQLLCKYSNMCEAECECCQKKECECRFECPPTCKCLRSADVLNVRTSQNIMVCDKLRWDKLGKLPSPLTQLHMNQTDWKVFETGKLKELSNLRALKITNSKMTTKEMEKLSDLANLTHLEITSSAISSIPDSITKLPSLTHLYLSDNPLDQLPTTSLVHLDGLKKIRLGGNFSRFACDCESPSDLQRWLMKKTNRAKIDDIDDLYCDLNGHGTVWMLEALPGTNESVCLDPTEETKQWMTFVENAQKGIMERVYTSTVPPTESGEKDEKMMTMMTPKKTILETLDELEGGKTTGKITTKLTSSTTVTTTPRYRKKYKDYDNEPHKFVNVLIFLLFLCVIILIISIGVTVYLKFWHPEELLLKRRKKERVAPEVRREEEPLQHLD